MSPEEPAFYRSTIAKAHELGRGGAFFAELFKPFDFTAIEVRKPTRTFSGELELKVGDKSVRLIELGPAHTRGDTIAFVPDDRIVFTGDLLFNEGTPLAWAGPVWNWVRACDRILALDVDVVVPGHGPIADKRAVRKMKGYLEFVQNEARKRYDKGMTALEAAFDIPLGRYADWGDAERLVVNVRNLFNEFSGEHAVSDTLTLFGEMSQLREKLRAAGQGRRSSAP